MEITRKKVYLGVGIIVFFWIASAVLISYFIPEKTDQGTFGDMFGAINALFSGLALFGVVVSILMQQNALKLQSDDLKLQRNELEQTRLEFKVNRITNIVFNKVEITNNIINSSKFYLTPTSSIDIYAFSSKLGDLYEDNNIFRVEHLLNSNHKQIKSLKGSLDITMSYLDSILEKNIDDKDQVEELKKMYADNIVKELFHILYFKTHVLDRSGEYHKVKLDFSPFDKKDEVKSLIKILRYGGNDEIEYLYDDK